MKLPAAIKLALSAAGLVAALWAGMNALDRTYARETRVAGIEKRQISGEQRDLQRELWGYQDRFGKNCERGDKLILDRCRNIIEQLKELQEELQELRKK